MSPPLSRLLQVLPSPDNEDQPLSLVLRKDENDTCKNSAAKIRTPNVKRHWKKFLKDQASTLKCEASPSKRLKFSTEQCQEEAENLCLSDIYRNAESTVAQALLSLGMADFRQKSPIKPVQALPLQPLSIHSLYHPQQVSIPSQLQISRIPFNSPTSENVAPIRLPQHPTPFTNLFVNNQSKPVFQSPFKEFKCNNQISVQHIQTQHQISRMSPVFSTSSFQNSSNNSTNFRLSRLLLPSTTENQLNFETKHPQNNAETIPSKKPYFCSDCKKGFSTQSGFIKHQELHRANQIQKTFSCKFCNKGYTSLSALKMHTRTHTLPCKCHICNKSFSRPWLLQGHVRTHTGEKPFSCNYCARSFADKSNLRAHLQTHLQTKKYSCQCCQKTFSRMSLLNKHTETGCQGIQSKIKSGENGYSGGLIRT